MGTPNYIYASMLEEDLCGESGWGSELRPRAPTFDPIRPYGNFQSQSGWQPRRGSCGGSRG